MRSNPRVAAVISVVFLLIFSGMIFAPVRNNEVQWEQGANCDYPLESMASTDKNAPAPLQSYSAVYDYFNDSSSYFYRTYTASQLYYQVVWINPIDPSKSPRIQLYSNIAYNQCLLSTGVGWYIVRPNVSQQLNIGVETDIGDNGSYYVGWEDSSSEISPGESVSGNLAVSDLVDAYGVFLDETQRYNINLSVPAGGDFDLWMYFPNITEWGFVMSIGIDPINYSTLVGIGLDEAIINWQPNVTGYCVLLVTWKDGAGTYILSFDCSSCPSDGPVLGSISPNPSLDGRVQLNWSDVVGASSYYVFRDTVLITDTTGLVAIANVTESNYTDNLTVDGQYFYVIVAGNPVRNSSISNCENVTVAISDGIPGFEFFYVLGGQALIAIVYVIYLKKRIDTPKSEHHLFWNA